jgi:hypothetical protein
MMIVKKTPSGQNNAPQNEIENVRIGGRRAKGGCIAVRTSIHQFADAGVFGRKVNIIARGKFIARKLMRCAVLTAFKNAGGQKIDDDMRLRMQFVGARRVEDIQHATVAGVLLLFLFRSGEIVQLLFQGVGCCFLNRWTVKCRSEMRRQGGNDVFGFFVHNASVRIICRNKIDWRWGCRALSLSIQCRKTCRCRMFAINADRTRTLRRKKEAGCRVSDARRFWFNANRNIIRFGARTANLGSQIKPLVSLEDVQITNCAPTPIAPPAMKIASIKIRLNIGKSKRMFAHRFLIPTTIRGRQADLPLQEQ